MEIPARLKKSLLLHRRFANRSNGRSFERKLPRSTLSEQKFAPRVIPRQAGHAPYR